MRNVFGALTCAIWLAACATTPNPRYYTLDMRPSGKVHPAVNLRIDRLRESEPLARKDILIQRGPTQLEYYALDQWAAAVPEQVGRKLAVEFGPVADNAPTFTLTGLIENFEQVDVPSGAEAYVRLTIEYRANGESRYSDPLKKKTYDVRLQAAKPGPLAVVDALSRCLETIAADIAADAAALPGPATLKSGG
jgi:uncharacterized lipoprotein YmbA